ncbi:hypothetical protein [Streptomyces fragilis]|uniref:PE-PGRS family protein n=1 Tax=Streptomyces fragilis TaxID=67301 RepID=A0ABV2YMX6_9ACTN|nr:hypothetical protein [Streptomyces fragilis]
MTTELLALMTAAEQWEEMAGEFVAQEEDYLREVHAVAAGSGQLGEWTGVAAGAARSGFDLTLAEFRAARKEALAVASLLQDAYAQFATLHKRLEAVRKEAEAAGLRVSGRGVVTVDEKTAEPPEPGETCGSVDGWQQRIDNAVRAVDDADRGVAIALRAVTGDGRLGDGTAGGFNAQAVHDVEVYEARAGSELARRMAGGEQLSPAETDELRRLFRDNQNDPAFGRAFLGGLGAEGMLAVASQANGMAHAPGGGDQARGMAEIVSGLSRTLATATRDTDSPWYEQWRSDMQVAGLEQHGSRFAAERLAEERGYQSLVSLMRQGGDFGSQYLADLGDDLIAAERKTDDLWHIKGPITGKDGWFANDPLDGVLGLMSRDPEGAAEYLRDEDRMKYLTADRNWHTLALESPGAPRLEHDADTLDADAHAGFAAALEAAATGVSSASPGAGFVEHTAANEEVFQRSVRHLAGMEDRFPEPLREAMGRIMANHGATVHQVASGFDVDGSPVSQSDLFEVAKQVSRDPQGYAALNVGLHTPMVEGIHRPDQTYPKDSLIQAARTVGFMEEVRAQAVQLESKPPEPPGWAAVANGVAAHIPVVGTEVQAGVDVVTGSWLEGEQTRFEQGLRDDRELDFVARGAQLRALTEAWWQVHGAAEGDPPRELKSQVYSTAGEGRDYARGITGAPR